MARQAPGVGDVVTFKLGPTTVQIGASGDSICTYKVPFKCRILKIKAGAEAENATSVTVDLENGTTDLVASPTDLISGGNLIAGGVEMTPDSGSEGLEEGDVLHMDVDITGTTVDGVWCEVVAVRE